MSGEPEPARYPLRRDVAKPAVIYQPGFGPSQAGGASADKLTSVAKPVPKPVPAAPSSIATGPNKVERVLGKRPRPEGRAAATEATAAGEDGVRSTHTPHRILAQRDFDDGVRYLVHWPGSTASDAQWVGARVLGAPPPLAPSCTLRSLHPVHPVQPIAPRGVGRPRQATTR